MKNLSLFLGGVALGAVGYGMKRWYDRAREENAYWTNEPKDIVGEMVGEAANKVYEGVEWLEEKVLGKESLDIAALYGGKEAIEKNPDLKQKYETHIKAIKSLFEKETSVENDKKVKSKQVMKAAQKEQEAIK